jgi:hypothetical protein
VTRLSSLVDTLEAAMKKLGQAPGFFSIRVADHAHDSLDKPRKSRFTVFCSLETHLTPHRMMCESPQIS